MLVLLILYLMDSNEILLVLQHLLYFLKCLMYHLLLELCDRIVVLCGGQVSGVVDGRKTNKLEVGALMTRVEGGKADE